MRQSWVWCRRGRGSKNSLQNDFGILKRDPASPLHASLHPCLPACSLRVPKWNRWLPSLEQGRHPVVTALLRGTLTILTAPCTPPQPTHLQFSLNCPQRALVSLGILIWGGGITSG